MKFYTVILLQPVCFVKVGEILLAGVCFDALINIFDQGRYIQTVGAGALTDGLKPCCHAADAAQTVISEYLHDFRM